MADGTAAATGRLARAKARLKPALPLDLGAFSLEAGLRAATACALPVLVAEIIGRHELSWIAIVAFWACLADTGGAWRTRFRAMASFTLLATIGCALALLAAPHLWLAVPFIFLWSFFGSLARIYGNAAATVGSLLTTAALVCLGTPAPSLTELLERAVMTLAGGAWAMLLALVIWRLYPHGPARAAVGECWRAIAHFSIALARLHEGASAAEDWARMIRERRGAARAAIETARAVLTQARRRQLADSRRGDLLLVLLADADQIIEALIGVSELLELANPDAPAALQRALRTVLARVARQADGVALSLTQRAVQHRRDVRPSLARLKRRIAAAGTADTGLDHAVALLDQVARYLAVAADAATGAAPPRELGAAITEPLAGPLFDWKAARAILAANLGIDSLAFRHALRIAVTAALAVTVTSVFRIERGYWLSITAVVILQPFMATTWRRALERVLGSVFGGLIAAAIGGLVRNPIAIAALVFPLSVVTVAVRGVNYTLFVLCLTPQFVLIAELFQSGGEADWNLAGLRALESVGGGLLGLAAGFLLWPAWEGPHLAARLAEALIAHRDYLTAVMAKQRGLADADVQAARRRAGLASNNAEASLQRLLGEPHRTVPRTVEAGMTIMSGVRRLAGVAAILSLLPAPITDGADPLLAATIDWAASALGALAAALRQGTPPPPLAAFDLPVSSPPDPTPDHRLLTSELARLRAQIAIIYGAATRLLGGDGTAERGEPSAEREDS